MTDCKTKPINTTDARIGWALHLIHIAGLGSTTPNYSLIAKLVDSNKMQISRKLKAKGEGYYLAVFYALKFARTGEMRKSHFTHFDLMNPHKIGICYAFTQHTGMGCMSRSDVTRNNSLKSLRIMIRAGIPICSGVIDFDTLFNSPLKIRIREALVLASIDPLIEEGFISPLMSAKKQRRYAEAVLGVLEQIKMSDKVHSNNNDLKYLNDNDIKKKFIGGKMKDGSGLFEQTTTYRVKTQSYGYKALPLMDKILKKAFDVVIEMPFGGSHGFEHSEDRGDYLPGIPGFMIQKKILKEIDVRDAFVLMANAVAGDDNRLWIELKEEDKQYSRKYSVFTSLKSKTRKKLGYMPLDFSAALQTIVLNIIDPNKEKYPWHWLYITDKHKMRAHFLKRFQWAYESRTITLDEVKTEVTAADNGRRKKKLRDASYIFDAYVNESEAMVDEFIAWAEKNNPTMLRRAKRFAKYEVIDTGMKRKNANGKYEKVFKQGKRKDKYSVFFFLWTQVERDAREIVIQSLRKQGYTGEILEVHDAVYIRRIHGQEGISIERLERDISNSIGIEIKLEKEQTNTITITDAGLEAERRRPWKKHPPTTRIYYPVGVLPQHLPADLRSIKGACLLPNAA